MALAGTILVILFLIAVVGPAISRGGHTREDFPKPDPEWGKRNVVARQRDGRLELATEPIPSVPDELRGLIGEDKPTGQVATGAPAAVGGTS